MKTILALALILMMGGVAMANDNHREGPMLISQEANVLISLPGYIHATITDIAELIEAAIEIEPYLNMGHSSEFIQPVYKTPAQRLREAADRIEREDAAIQRFRKALERFK